MHASIPTTLLAILVAAATCCAQAPDAEADLRARVEQAISSFEPLPDAAELWQAMPTGSVDILIETVSNTGAPAPLRAGALNALAYFDDDVAERNLRATALDAGADALRVHAAGALARLGSRAPERAASVLLALETLAAAGDAGRDAAIEALPSLSDPGALTLLDRLVADAADDMVRLSLHRARGEWLAMFGAAAPHVRLVAEQGELLAEAVRLFVEPDDLGEPGAHRVRLLTSSSVTLAGDSAALRVLASGETWALERQPGARHFWVAAEVLRLDADGALDTVVTVQVLHVFRMAR